MRKVPRTTDSNDGGVVQLRRQQARDDHDAAVARVIREFDARIVRDATAPDGSIPGRYGSESWGDLPAAERGEPCTCCPKTTPAERAASLRRYGSESEAEHEPGPACDLCGAVAVVPYDPDDSGEELMCHLWWRRGVHHCEICERRPGAWRGHAWVCDRCVARVVADFRGACGQGAS
jgi:hypothetical protein